MVSAAVGGRPAWPVAGFAPHFCEEAPLVGRNVSGTNWQCFNAWERQY